MKTQSKTNANAEFADRIVRRYTYAYFDHLHSEYLRIVPTLDDEKKRVLIERLEPIIERRKSGELTWQDVYTFDLEILDLLSEEDLVRKAYDMRSKYRSFAGARDYDAYIASKPPDLSTLQLEAIKKTEDQVSVATEVLRADIRYLLGQFYLYYSLMPLREELRGDLTRRARKWTLIFMGISILLAISILILNLLQKVPSEAIKTAYSVVSWTAWWVIFAGIMGGCISMLQRIQSAPNEGDGLYNLAALSHGWKGISLSPLYGAIFAILLYVLFTAGILKGSVFPEIQSDKEAQQAQKPCPPCSQEQAGATTTAPESASTEGPAKSGRDGYLPFSDTAPVGTKDYALLVIWSFIGGFAERLVPDTLNRLVTKNQSIQGTT